MDFAWYWTRKMETEEAEYYGLKANFFRYIWNPRASNLYIANQRNFSTQTSNEIEDDVGELFDTAPLLETT